VGGVATGVLHEDDAGKGILPDRPEIDGADLIAREGTHSRFSIRDSHTPRRPDDDVDAAGEMEERGHGAR
jgi:hypothetical protein